jgi:benzylsuccinate CoA-transferase BbsF subunit
MTRLPLEGIKVLDFCWVMAGPVMTSMLGDLGADVIKIETRRRMDAIRFGRPVVGDTAAGDQGQAEDIQPFQHAMHRNKLGITLNVATPDGRDIARKLVGETDVVAENFSAGTMDRLGLGYGELSQINPRLVMVSISAAGQSGPMHTAVSLNPIAVALSGLGSLLGYEGETPLGVMRNFYGDTNAGFHGTIAVLAALFRARRTGIGEYIDLSQWEASMSGMELQFAEAAAGMTPAAVGNRHAWKAPHGTYPAAGERPGWNWIAIHCDNNNQWQALCRVLGLGALASDPRLVDVIGRLEHRDQIDSAIAAVTQHRDKTELAEELQANGVPAAPVMDVGNQFESEHFRDRGVFTEAHHDSVGYELVQALPWKTTRIGRGQFRRPAPTMGRDNHIVFGEMMGMPDSEIEVLKERGVIY